MESWRPVYGYEGTYSVSSGGRVKRNDSGRILSLRSLRNGYPVVSLSVDGIAFSQYVHRLVLDAFVGPQPHLQANHIDGIKTHNELTNLEWCTIQENITHAAKLGLLAVGDKNGARLHPEKIKRGDDHWSRRAPDSVLRGERRSKLTAACVAEIRKMSEVGVPQHEIAKVFGLSRGGVSIIVTRRTWRHVP